MKQTFTLAALAVIALTFASCGNLSLTAPKMDTEKGIQQALDAVKLDYNEYKPIFLRITEEGKLTNDVFSIQLRMVSDNNSNYTQSFIVTGSAKGPTSLDTDKFTRETFDFATMEWLDPRTVSAGKIIANIDAAKAQIPSEYKFESLHSYRMQLVKGKIEEDFEIFVTEVGKREKYSAGQKVIEYYELNFKVREDGSVYCKDLE